MKEIMVKLFKIMNSENYSKEELKDKEYLRDRIETILEWDNTFVDDNYIYEFLIPLYLNSRN